jgi:hypothetical protein
MLEGIGRCGEAARLVEEFSRLQGGEATAERIGIKLTA